jgi:hypothetical protein
MEMLGIDAKHMPSKTQEEVTISRGGKGEVSGYVAPLCRGRSRQYSHRYAAIR